MAVGLTRTTIELSEAFKKLDHPRDVADLLEVPYSRLVYHLYKVPPASRYTVFEIPKRTGEVRCISAPISPIKILQKKFNEVLKTLYEPKPSVHGFVRGRNIRTNALSHSHRKCVFIVDIAEFFPSINFGRVYGMFKAKPFNFKGPVATVLAQLCTFEDCLPQGAPTSPIISNLICQRLDRELRKIARRHNCIYTRYADDLTFSCNRDSFPIPIGGINAESGVAFVGDEVEKIIRSNGFRVNIKKVRLLRQMQRQLVTGLVTNNSPNVRRRYVRQIRAMLHAVEKYGFEAAEKHFHAKYFSRHRRDDRGKPSFRRVLKGKIEFLGMVRGKLDQIYITFLRKLHSLDATLVKNLPAVHWVDEIKRALFVIDSRNGHLLQQGSGFLLKGHGLVTCSHALGEDLEVYQPSDPSKKFPVEVVAQDKTLDIALLKITASDSIALPLGNDTGIREDDEIILAGFPNYAPGHSGIVKRGRVVSTHIISGQQRMLIDATIVTGNSGGPVLDNKRRVIGIAVTGVDSEGSSHTTERFGVIPISTLSRLSSS